MVAAAAPDRGADRGADALLAAFFAAGWAALADLAVRARPRGSPARKCIPQNLLDAFFDEVEFVSI